MLINEQTKIAALLKHNPEALEAIVPLSADFTKLRNPILRKLMAGRTTIAMASKIGGCSPADFFNVLLPLGFEIDKQHQPTPQAPTTNTPLPTFIQQAKTEDIVALDVRSMLAAGNDPLQLIQKTVKDLQQGQLLKITNTFEPTPLINLLGKQGFLSHVEVKDANLVETYFYKQNNAPAPQLEAVTDEADDYASLIVRFKNKIREIDVRHLEMPQPMTTILEALDTLPKEMALYVHHKRIPVFLLTELKDRGFEYRVKEIADGVVDLLIFKD